MRSRRVGMSVVAAAAGAMLTLAGPAQADPVNSPNILTLQMSCGGTTSQLYVSPASGARRC